MARLCALEIENERLKRMYTDLAPKLAAMKETVHQYDRDRVAETAGAKG